MIDLKTKWAGALTTIRRNKRVNAERLHSAFCTAMAEAHIRGRIYTTSGEKAEPGVEFDDTMTACERVFLAELRRAK